MNWPAPAPTVAQLGVAALRAKADGVGVVRANKAFRDALKAATGLDLEMIAALKGKGIL